MLRESRNTLGIVRSRFVSGLRLRTLDAKALTGCLTIFAVLCVYRFYDYWTTGFYVSDEYGYYFDAVRGAIYSDRWFVGWLNIVIFRAFGITNVDSFSYLLPFYLFFWAAFTLVVFRKILRLLDFDEVTTALSLLSSMVLISFVLLSMGFLTEPVGLSMVMLGIYFLVRYFKSGTERGNVAFPFLSACFFGFAAGTREPYNAFLVGGIAIVAWLALRKSRDMLRITPPSRRALATLSILMFFLPSMFFIFVPTHAFSQQISPISSQLFQSITSNPVTSGGTVTTITTTTVVNHTTTTIATSETTAPPAVPFYRQFVLTNTLLIFFGGIFLGWGPICFAVAVAGFLMLLRRSIRGQDSNARFMFFTAVVALSSYFIVSFIYAPDPNYFSFQDYSTVIRFSDTALPAYFMIAPVVLAYIASSRKRIVGFAAISVVVLLALVPVYEVYAASNLNYTTQNPFQLGYRTDAAIMREYFSANTGQGPLYLIGHPYGWAFTPGVQDLNKTGGQTYAIGQDPYAPHLVQANFTSLMLTNFYLYVQNPPSFPDSEAFLSAFTNSTAGNGSASSQTGGGSFTIVESRPVLTTTDFTLYHVVLSRP